MRFTRENHMGTFLWIVFLN